MFRICFLLYFICSFSALACNLNSSQPIAAKIASMNASSTSRTVLISNNTHLIVPSTVGTLQVHDAQDFSLVLHLASWPVAGNNIAPIVADPFIVDTNYDGIADQVYIVDSSGMLWVIPIANHSFGAPTLIADFSDSGFRFEQPVHVVQTLAADRHGILRPQATVLLIGSDAQGDWLLAVKHRSERSDRVRYIDLVDRSSVSDEEVRFGVAEQLWTEIQESAGWRLGVQQRVTVVPQVYGGVVYFTTVGTENISSRCELSENALVFLHAIHLHHAGLIYAHRNWLTSANTIGTLSMQVGVDGEFVLVYNSEAQQIPLLSDLQRITAECADCVSSLRADQFPLTLRLATFQLEAGAH